jgi:hypothetical protein
VTQIAFTMECCHDFVASGSTNARRLQSKRQSRNPSRALVSTPSAATGKSSHHAAPVSASRLLRQASQTDHDANDGGGLWLMFQIRMNAWSILIYSNGMTRRSESEE